jgi:hypothetical protein
MKARTLAIALAVVTAAAAATVAGAQRPDSGRARSWIVYWSTDPWPSIWAVRPDRSHRHRIVRTRRNAKRPRLSPDRAWVAFDGAPPAKPLLRDFDVQIVRLDGSGRRTLTTWTDVETDAQWSPDGQWLSFTRAPPNPVDCTGSSVWIIRRDGSAARRVVDGCGARWAPDGTRLVARRRSAGGRAGERGVARASVHAGVRGAGGVGARRHDPVHALVRRANGGGGDDDGIRGGDQAARARVRSRLLAERQEDPLHAVLLFAALRDERRRLTQAFAGSSAGVRAGLALTVTPRDERPAPGARLSRRASAPLSATLRRPGRAAPRGRSGRDRESAPARRGNH